MFCRRHQKPEKDVNFSNQDSFHSIVSGESQNQHLPLVHAAQEGIYPVELPPPPAKDFFIQHKFSLSVVIYFNNSKHNRKLNPFVKAMSAVPEVYKKHFPSLDMAVSSHTFISDLDIPYMEGLEIIIQTDAFLKHLKITNKLIASILDIAMHDDISSVILTLKRIGAKHAELGLPAKYVYAFRESFLASLDKLLDHDKDVIRAWEIFIKYVVNYIVEGMNDHYRKILFVYWSVNPRKTCLCMPATIPRRISQVDHHALNSLKNMANSIEAQMDD